ncbi:S-layer homology domain-containing protein [Psychrobacillus glaciei]
MGKGLIKDYENGSFKPDGMITKAEFMALVNR